MGTNQVAPLCWVAIALARPGPVPAHTILVPIRTDHCQNKTIARAELLRNYYEIHGAVLFPLECSQGEPSSWRPAPRLYLRRQSHHHMHESSLPLLC